MTRTLPSWIIGLMILAGGGLILADPPKNAGPPDLPDLSEFKTPETAVTARISRAGPIASTQPAYLGVYVAPDPKGKLILGDIATESPAARAGLRKGDVLVRVEGQDLTSPEALHQLLQTRAPGDTIQLAVTREGTPPAVSGPRTGPGRPWHPGTPRAVLGLQVGEPAKDGEGVPITQISTGSPAERVKLKVGEVILKIDGTPVTSPDKLRAILSDKKTDDTVTLTLLLAEKAVDLKVPLAAETGLAGRPFAWNTRAGNYWKKDVFRLAVVCIEYPDVKHNPKIAAKDWEESLFSKGTYTKASVTGQTVYGSLNDYYLEQSYGALHVEGKVFEYVEASKKRIEYNTGDKSVLLKEALDKILERDGKDALENFDGVTFIYAGGRVADAPRGSLYWPHRASVSHKGKSWPYFICPEGGDRMGNISVYCHEFGHMLGLPDLYAQPENPGSEGLSVWCAMSNQVGNGKPQHFCAWSKEKLEWVKPAVIDPTVPQKLVLAPIEDSPKECFKVLVRPDGSEYLLLENRRKKGFDESLPAEGLLIWRVVQNRPFLEESHGVEGPAGPRVFTSSIPYPSAANNAFTPYTTPSSRSQLGGGLPVYITNIRRLADGRVTFYIGYEYE